MADIRKRICFSSGGRQHCPQESVLKTAILHATAIGFTDDKYKTFSVFALSNNEYTKDA